jgi:MFS family permease
MSAVGPKRSWLNRTVIGIALASLFSDVGHEMATTAMPILIASIGASSATLGLIEGVADGIASFAKLVSGAYSDRLERRKPLAALGYFMTAAGMASFALATSAWHVLLGRVVGWLGRGARTPVRKVLLTEATTPETYGRAFGFERSMDSAGAVLGPLIALALVTSVGVRTTFAVTLVPGIAAALLITFAVREGPHAGTKRGGLFEGVGRLPARFRRLLVGVGIAGLGDFSNTLLILWATQAWTPTLGAKAAATTAMAFYVGYNVVYTISCYASGALADRVSKQKLLALGYALAAIPAAVLATGSTSYVAFAIVFAISGLYMGVWETVESASAATYLPADVRGVGFGVLATVNGIGDLLSSVIVGALFASAPRIAMSYVVVTSLVGAGIIATTREEREVPA